MSYGRFVIDGVRERGKVRVFIWMRGRNSWFERFSLILIKLVLWCIVNENFW